MKKVQTGKGLLVQIEENGVRCTYKSVNYEDICSFVDDMYYSQFDKADPEWDNKTLLNYKKWKKRQG
jgi:hypothetical protein